MEEGMDDCIFCNIVRGNTDTKLLYQDQYLVVFDDIYPEAATHILIVPRLHITSLAALTEEHTQLMAHMIMYLPKIAAKLGLLAFRTVINTGAASGQKIFHLHVHILGGGIAKVV